MKENLFVIIEESRKPERFSLKLPGLINSEGVKMLVEIILRRKSGAGKPSKVGVQGTVFRAQPDGMVIRFEKRVQFSPLH